MRSPSPSASPSSSTTVTCRHGTGPPRRWRRASAPSGTSAPLRCGRGASWTRRGGPSTADAFDPRPSRRRAAARALRQGSYSPEAPPRGACGSPVVPFFGVRRESLGDGFRDGRGISRSSTPPSPDPAPSRSGPSRATSTRTAAGASASLASRSSTRCGVAPTTRAASSSRSWRTVRRSAVLADFGRQLFANEGMPRDDDAAHRFVAWLGDAALGRRLLVLDDVQGSWAEVSTRFRERVEVRRARDLAARRPRARGGADDHTASRDPGARPFPGPAARRGRGRWRCCSTRRASGSWGGPRRRWRRRWRTRCWAGTRSRYNLAGAYVRRAKFSFADYRRLLAKGVIRQLEEAAKQVGGEIDTTTIARSGPRLR